jgi:membrane protein DedA with SNARE-associated domain
MQNWVADILQQLGYVGLALLMLAENLFPPIPSELIMPLAGYLAAREQMLLWGVIAAGTLGSVAGSLPLYAAGRRLGKQRAIRWADDHGRWLTVCGRHVERAIAWLDRHGAWAVFLARLVPGLRSLIAVPAGIARMNLALFLALTTLGSAIWCSALAAAGLWLGRRFDQVDDVVGLASNVVLGGVVLLYAWRVARGKGRRRE